MEKPLNLKEDQDEAGVDVEAENKEEDKPENGPDGTITAASNTKDDCSDLTDNNNDTEEQAPKSFPQRLMEILSNESNTEVISWLPHGTGFLIHKKKTFANEILPHYFKASKFTSFTRKLNRWGFSRVPRGPETGAYFHKLFRRDKPDLCLQMTSNSGNKYQSNPMHQQLLPNVPGMMPNAGMPMFPYMNPMMNPMMAANNPMMANMSPQQQQAMWQQQMQQMMLYQQQQMMQMQQQGQMAGPMGIAMMGGGMAPNPVGGVPPAMAAGGGSNGEMPKNEPDNSGVRKDETDAGAENTDSDAKPPEEEEV